MGNAGEGVFDLAGAVVGSGGSVALANPALVGEGARVGAGAVIAALTVVEEPAGTDTSTPPALVTTVPLMVTIVVSPVGDTETYESDPARMTEAIPALRTS
jgi:hypothetical protein